MLAEPLRKQAVLDSHGEMETDAADDAKDVMETKADLCLLVSWVWIYVGTFNAQPPFPARPCWGLIALWA